MIGLQLLEQKVLQVYQELMFVGGEECIVLKNTPQISVHQFLPAIVISCKRTHMKISNRRAYDQRIRELSSLH